MREEKNLTFRGGTTSVDKLRHSRIENVLVNFKISREKNMTGS